MDARIHLDRERLRIALTVHRELHNVFPRYGPRSSAAEATTTTACAAAALSLFRRRPMQVPQETMHSGSRFRRQLRVQPCCGNVDGARIDRAWRIVAGIPAHEFVFA